MVETYKYKTRYKPWTNSAALLGIFFIIRRRAQNTSTSKYICLSYNCSKLWGKTYFKIIEIKIRLSIKTRSQIDSIKQKVAYMFVNKYLIGF